MNLILTEQDIERDIAGFKDRVLLTRNKLVNLPSGFLTYHEHKLREKQRRDLLADIQHIQKMIEIASKALEEPC
jgi:hypothetical protein